MQNKKIGKVKLAELTGERQSTLQWYCEIGILPFEQKDFNLARRFDLEQAKKRLKEIRSLKSKGRTLEEIKKHFKV